MRAFRYRICSLLICLLLFPLVGWGQNYATLWKDVKSAQKKDLPATELALLQQIIDKAKKERSFGNLFKAELMQMQTLASISPDSLLPAVERMEATQEATTEMITKSVYLAILSKIYSGDTSLHDADKAARYAGEAMRFPYLLAATKASEFEPLTVEGDNAGVFGDDMLSVIGYELGMFGDLYEYYSGKGNRKAACVAGLYLAMREGYDRKEYSLKESPYLHYLDSIISVYGDLDVAGEVAVERYYGMLKCRNVKVEDKINYIHYALEHWGSWQRMGELRNEEKELTAPMFRMSGDGNVSRPGETKTFKIVKARNISQLTMNVYHLKTDGDIALNPQSANDLKKIMEMAGETPVATKTLQYMGKSSYQIFDDSLSIGPLPLGVYLLEVTTTPATDTEYALYFVTDNFLLSQTLPNNTIRYVALSASTGQPLAGADLRLTLNGGAGEEPSTETLPCDENGEVIYTYDGAVGKPQKAFLYTSTDSYYPESRGTGYFSFDNADGKGDGTQVFTDRKIYRPGQTVHAAAIVYRKTSHVAAETVPAVGVSASLVDANGKVVEEKEVVTDDYGTCSADFTLPQNGLTGMFSVVVNGKSASIRVEQYKRPSFKVEFPEVNTRYQSGDTLSIQAKAISYSGMPVQGGNVVCRVYRRKALWWRGGMSVASSDPYETLLCETTTVTDGDGRFVVELPLTMPAGEGRRFYNFVVEADVTDVSGETHSGVMSVPLGSHPTAISSNLRDKELADSLESVTIYLKNNAGINVNTAVRMRIDDGEWVEGRTMTPISLPAILPSGRHSLYALCDSDTLCQQFVTFGLDDQVPCVATDDWFYVSSASFGADGSPITVQVGSSDTDVHVVYSVISGDKVIESGAFKLDNSIDNRKLEYKEEYGNGLLLTYAWIKDGKCHTHQQKLTMPVPDNRLHLRWTTFRDRLLPGQQEEWTLSVTDGEGNAADAQMMATLFDASLDQLSRHQWSVKTGVSVPLPSTRWIYQRHRGISLTATQAYSKLKYRSFGFSHFDADIFPQASPLYSTRTMLMARSLGGDATDGGVMAISDTATPEETTAESDAPPATTIEENIRQNMDETAFFYPSLTTDKEGNVTIAFTLPETLTSWRFMGLAHTKDMRIGTLEGEAVAQKEVMTQPYMPRFVRVGDKAVIAAKVFNTGNANATGTVRIELSDPESGLVVFSDQATFSADVDKTAEVEFEFSPTFPSQMFSELNPQPLLVCKIVASGRSANGNYFCDGEQHYLPVLPDKEMVTVTAPFTLRGASTTSVDISKMFGTKDALSKLTVEYTDNPLWMLIQALMPMSLPKSGNAMDQCASLYANLLAKHIADSNPAVCDVFGKWSREDDGNSLISNLAKNVELKDIVLEETPWVANAEMESDQKQSLAYLFDEDAMDGRLVSALDKLAHLQGADGSWAWWQGMRSNARLTSAIVEMLVRLQTMVGQDGADSLTSSALYTEMLSRAQTYLDTSFAQLAQRMMEDESLGRPQSFPGITALQYLYSNAISHRQLSAECQKASDYLVGLLKKEIATQSIYSKAVTAIILHYNGETATAREYARSLKEYTSYDEEAGRYYDTQRADYSWMDYRIPTQVAAIEALKVITPDDSGTIDEMLLWLLQEKRTQAWDTPVNSANAIYAFTMGGQLKALTVDDGMRASLSVDGATLALPEATAGMGYAKLTLPMREEEHYAAGTSISPSVKTFVAEKSDEGVAWGALYAQFMQKSGDIAKSGEGLSVKRDIIAPKEGLKVGARLTVRITITATRDFDFVQVVDRRAACLEPVEQLSGYGNGAYCTPKDNTTNYYFDTLRKGKKTIETQYFISRIGTYETGSCTVSCAYAPEYRATAKSEKIVVKDSE